MLVIRDHRTLRLPRQLSHESNLGVFVFTDLPRYGEMPNLPPRPSKNNTIILQPIENTSSPMRHCPIILQFDLAKLVSQSLRI